MTAPHHKKPIEPVVLRRLFAGLLSVILAAPAAAREIRITDFEVKHPGTHSFRVILEAEAREVKIGSYGISTWQSYEGKTWRQLDKEDYVPPGFKRDNAYASPEENGRIILEEGREDIAYTRTFSVEGWEPGLHAFTASVSNRPAPGPWTGDSRHFIVKVTEDGKIAGFNPSEVENTGGEHVVIYRDGEAYSAFPSLFKVEGEEDMLYTDHLARVYPSHTEREGERIRHKSGDGGLTWQEARGSFINPLWRTPEGSVLRVRAAEGGRVEVRIRERDEADRDTIFMEVDDVDRLMGGLGPRGGLVTSEDVIIVAFYGRRKGSGTCEIFFARSEDHGRSWDDVNPMLPSPPEDRGYQEPALVETEEGNIICLMRTDPRGYLYQSVSEDGGLNWSEPEKTPIWGFPASLINLPGGKILASYSYRRPPMGIRACVSRDGGRTWDMDNEYVLRADGGGRASGMDIGYPYTVRLSDGSLFTAYYFISQGEGIYSNIEGTRWELQHREDIPEQNYPQ